VWSPNDRPGATNAKIREYLASGVKFVWLVEHEERCVTVYRPKQDMEVIGESGELTGGDDLPGLVIRVADIFKLPRERGAAPPPPPPAA
jgi:Uma2 family endonuclease